MARYHAEAPTAMKSAGFVVASVRTLDKQQGSYRQVTSTAVKQDLVISAYRPNGGLEQRFRLEAGTEEAVWDFVRTHLRQLPRFIAREDQAEVIAERQAHYLLKCPARNGISQTKTKKSPGGARNLPSGSGAFVQAARPN